MKKYLFISCFFFLCVFCFFHSISFYQEEIIESNNKTNIAILINGEATDTFPKKDSNLKVKSIFCNEGTSYWDYENWSLRVRNISNTRIKCNVEFVTQYSESILNGTDPILKDNLIPVTIDSNGTVRKANLGTEWYSYENKVWANAVILESDSKSYYDGEEIPESNIESYFVWIPRYKYKIFNEGDYSNLIKETYQEKSQEIEIVFENKNTPVSNGSTVGSYLTHPAFTSFNSNGMWVGKFETGYKGATTKVEAEQNVVNTTKVQIKPNVYSWRGIQIANMHLNSYNYKRNLDSHMMKNTEWGSVAYLSHSKYGNQNIQLNNNSDMKTGYSAINEPTCGWTNSNEECNRYGTSEDITKPYNSNVGYLASTTGNISGIYDMSGGAWELVMGLVMNQQNQELIGRNNLYHSGFNGLLGCPTCENLDGSVIEIQNQTSLPDKFYYDRYAYSISTRDYSRRILGDATGETGPFQTQIYLSQTRDIGSWHSNNGHFINSYNQWFSRGGCFNYGINANINTFNGSWGEVGSLSSYRIVLTPQKI